MNSLGHIICASFAAFSTVRQAVYKTQSLPLTHFCVAASGNSPCTPSDWLQHRNPRPPWTVRKIGHHGPLFFLFFSSKRQCMKTAAELDQAAQQKKERKHKHSRERVYSTFINLSTQSAQSAPRISDVKGSYQTAGTHTAHALIKHGSRVICGCLKSHTSCTQFLIQSLKSCMVGPCSVARSFS